MYLLQKFFWANNNRDVNLITSKLFIAHEDALREMHKQAKTALTGIFDEDAEFEDSGDQVRISGIFDNIWIVSEIEDEPVRKQSDELIPIGGEYTFAKTKETIVGNGVDVYFPEEMQLGDHYDDEFYRYIFGVECGLSATARKRDLANYGPLRESVCGEPLKNIDGAFYGCKKMRVAPKIPETVTSMARAFTDCEQLATAPEIPSGVSDMAYAFCGCSNLSAAPVIPEGVTFIDDAFKGCTNLSGTLVCNANPDFYEKVLLGTRITAIEGSCFEVIKIRLRRTLKKH